MNPKRPPKNRKVTVQCAYCGNVLSVQHYGAGDVDVRIPDAEDKCPVCNDVKFVLEPLEEGT